ncbi:MAG: hypothetical protein E7383_07810 [Ruminococcaceae bacterium]|jgi:hypothetical protein|nr:hypothetical protein [Oscillospiraceae bacterium]
MGVFALLLAIGLGFGLACLIFASLLDKSNDIGNSIASSSRYSIGINYDRSLDKLKKDEKESFTIGYIHKEDYNPNEPSSEKLVDQTGK